MGQASAPFTFTFQNAGAVSSPPVHATTTVIGSPLPVSGPPFVVDDGGCADVSLAPGGRCTVQVHFAPTQAGLVQGELSLVVPGKGTGVAIRLSGMGGPPSPNALAISPTTLVFDRSEVGDPPQELALQVANAGTATLPSVNVALSGPNADDFVLHYDNCSDATLLSGGGCAMIVDFVPKVAGASSQATLTASSGDMTAVTDIHGSANPAAALELTPDDVDLGSSPVGIPGGSTTFTVTNVEPSTSVTIGVTLDGPDAEDFTLDDGCALTALGPEASCSFQISFVPSRIGLESAIILVDGSPNPPSTRMTGTGLGADAGP